jgi:hypothetical protein
VFVWLAEYLWQRDFFFADFTLMLLPSSLGIVFPFCAVLFRSQEASSEGQSDAHSLADDAHRATLWLYKVHHLPIASFLMAVRAKKSVAG